MQTDRVSAAESAERFRGIGLMCLAVIMFTVIDTSAKYAGRYVPVIEIVWARYAVGLIISLVVLRPWRDWSAYRTNRPIVHSVRALALLLSTVFNFLAVQELQLAVTSAIVFAAPLLTTALAGPVLGEWAGPRRWAAIVVGVVGVIVIVQPEPGSFNPAAIYSVAGAFCYAGYALTTRMLSATETPASQLVYGSLLAVILLTPALPGNAILPPTWDAALALAMAGLAATIGHWLLIQANRYAPAPVLAPFNYTQLIWMVIAGYVFFGDLPGPSTLIGAAIIVASGLYVLYRERVHRDR